jgi:hypothetical protein
VFKKIILPIIALVIIAVGAYILLFNDKPQAQEPMIQGVTENSDTSQVSTPVDSTGMESKLYDVIRNYPGLKVGVSVNDVNTQNSANISKDYSFIAASTTKVLIATYTYDQAQKGNINLDDILVPKSSKSADFKPISFGENIYWMIVKSDNESWKDLMDYFGYDNIDSYINGLGYKSFTTNGNVISANDMAGFLKQLAKGELIKGENLDELLGYMSQSWTGPLTLEDKYQDLSKKTGWLEDRMHFVGIMGNGDNQKTFSIYTETTDKGVIDYTYSTALINDLLSVIESNPV